ncbi:MAG TPA: F0F1 ATP synthase subunit delta [Woeseiaceae bacterium]
MADNNTIARPYAEAVFELAREADALSAWSEALQVASALVADGQVISFLANPTLTEAKRLEFLTGLLQRAAGDSSILSGNDRQGVNFLKLVLENGREAVLPEVSSHFEALKAEVENTVDVTVTSAAPLNDGQKRTIADALKKRLGRQVRLETKLDESLIGGAVIRAGDVVIDGSLRARLEGLAHALTA